MSGPTAEEIAKAMTEAVELNDRLKARFNATVAFSVDGSDPFILKCTKSGKSSEKPDLQVKTSLDVLQALLAKKITPQQAFMKGKLKIKGNMGLAMKLQLVLDATRKHMGSQTARL
ncbi:whole genome shotgun sequence [Seminavis robusta]|uniref:Whole genome shotgun sequence n=1 Tax=Seminavis robusta TaxID=568900 RepID=A0A9N8DYL5_9STRA|nr:whole genome shotgun sequence [Seminavis robusta]|eukprot:Sro372_g128750.1 whole genome shotgun sequence (116) ;mRNA; f:20871-21218